MSHRAEDIEAMWDALCLALAGAAQADMLDRPINFRRDLTWDEQGFWAVDLAFRFVPHDSIAYMASKGLNEPVIEIAT